MQEVVPFLRCHQGRERSREDLGRLRRCREGELMDIVRRAYQNVHGVPGPEDPVYKEVVRLIEVHGYAKRDWPSEWGKNPFTK